MFESRPKSWKTDVIMIIIIIHTGHRWIAICFTSSVNGYFSLHCKKEETGWFCGDCTGNRGTPVQLIVF